MPLLLGQRGEDPVAVEVVGCVAAGCLGLAAVGERGLLEVRRCSSMVWRGGGGDFGDGNGVWTEISEMEGALMGSVSLFFFSNV